MSATPASGLSIDRTAFAARWASARPVVAAFLSAALRDPQSVDDLLQETAVTLLEHPDQYDPTRPFTPWAVGVARNHLRGFWRSRRKHGAVLDDDALLDQLESACTTLEDDLAAERQALGDCLRSLAGRAWEVLRLRHVDEQPAPSIARRLGMKADQVRTILKRTRDGLRACIERRLAAA
ncbi:DNA-directed RNA polymerase sigma-70 factor [Planctomycetota bacterium]|nr:DNA-directed RNA polymerase sigma-70 factor [Planctomycetota bacterium]